MKEVLRLEAELLKADYQKLDAGPALLAPGSGLEQDSGTDGPWPTPPYDTYGSGGDGPAFPVGISCSSGLGDIEQAGLVCENRPGGCVECLGFKMMQYDQQTLATRSVVVSSNAYMVPQY
eukprot:COSAG05_NODE_1135_length_5760_cov_9.624448_3_plen_120_part_00